MFLRYFATTDDSYIGVAALAYLRSLIRIAPVRLISPMGLEGGLRGAWSAFDGLLYTPMTGPYINVVCTAPARWRWRQNIAAPKRQIVRPGDVLAADELEHISDMVELYTVGVRNVLIVAAPPVGHGQIAAAQKYEAVVIADPMWMDREWSPLARTLCIPHPVVHAEMHQALHNMVTGPLLPPTEM